jgi:hypothetical protein
MATLRYCVACRTHVAIITIEGLVDDCDVTLCASCFDEHCDWTGNRIRFKKTLVIRQRNH